MASLPIIIADRSELFARGVTQLLADHGYEVVGVAATSEEALTLAAAHPDSLVLVDEAIGGAGAAPFIRSLLDGQPRPSRDRAERLLGPLRGRHRPRRRSRPG